ncbi:MAG TPA: type II secretion system secretin GspD, partial [Alphaproteobacteria bacterium]
YNVVPAAAAPATPGSGVGNIGELTEIVKLRFASAPELAKVLEPYVGPGGKIAAGPAKDSLLVGGGPSVRASLIALIRTFDVDFLAGQSYAIFPVASDDPARVAAEVQHFVQAAGQSDAPGPVHVMPLDRISAILVVAPEPRYLARIGDFLDQVEEVGDTTSRRLHVYYVQNGSAVELGAVLQRAFAPQSAPADATPGDQGLVGSLAPGGAPTALATPSAGFTGQSAGTPRGSAGGLGGAPLGSSANPAPQGAAVAAPLSSLSPTGPGADSQSAASTKGIRIIPDRRNNALLIFATPSEYSLIEAALRKIDVLPLQVLVEATVAEVTLNDALQYGTQFFLKQHDNSEVLSNVANGAIGAVFPGFAYTFTSSPAVITLSALQSVTRVKVISSPQLVVLDNQSARLQVGDIVPIATQSAVSVLTTGAPVVNSIEYRETGVILQVTPRVNSGGLVTLDIDQEVSQVVPTTTSALNSPTIQQRKIRSRVVVQDGDTIGLGGLIKDSSAIGNSGIPWLTDIPVLGALFGTRTDVAQRTELLVLLTPRVVQDQRSARALTEDLRLRLGRLGSIPYRRDPIEPRGPLRR